jgi:hypothetical protein
MAYPAARPFWLLLLRRSYGIPDIVPDEVATDALTQITAKAPSLVAVRGQELRWAETRARLLIEAIVRLGDAGALNECLLPDKVRDDVVKAQNRDKPPHEIVSPPVLIAQGAAPTSASDGSIGALAEAATETLKTVTRFLDRNPWFPDHAAWYARAEDGDAS